MSLEQTILILIWLAGAAAVIFCVPHSQLRQFILAALLCQAITWLSVLLHVRFHLLSFPVREFPKATDMSFTLQYMLNPILCGFYLIHETRHSRLARVAYLLAWTSGISLVHTGLARYTRLMDYVNYNGFFKRISVLGILLLVSGIVRWFYQKPFVLQTGKDN